MKSNTQRHAEPDVSATGMNWVETLMKMDTTSRNSNLGLIETVRDYCDANGLVTTLTYDASGKKANLFATVPDANGETDGGVVLSGHTDVVPVDGQQWDTDPFSPVVKDGKLYGRGACDMKGFIGVALGLVPTMRGAALKSPLHFALSYDEEIGCAGAPVMLADLKKRGIRLDGCIVGEPSSMRVVVAHKGINAYRCCVNGHAAHSSLTPKGVNAIEYAARLICHIQTLAERFRAKGPFDDAFDVPFTTAQTGTIRGGIAVNTVPANCEFEFEFRNLPGVNAQAIYDEIRHYAQNELVPQMRVTREEADITFETISTAPALDVAEQAAINGLVRALQRDTATRKVAYATEAGLFQTAGIPSIVCGPGNIEQAHKPNEFVELEQLAACERFLQKLIVSVSSDAA
ncbi:acetylornithine deacetylase [Paraburkholderia sp.]|uniref:acetylornithine deacetylase n=1 Tax=Paraburkholderia sp. TaxID=1926495 RepID=UPI0023851869|nr:acetylornithine deacetylase [Paraburkholderia sp.]MDE1179991.1 acetylornithine deacetylase [Paraburkholderia sp.]